jgi:diguanylate cyclase (GGDEF)-like protein/PAS domain S-box-containing protein
VAAVLVFAATLVATLSTLAVAERGMKAVIGNQQYSMLQGAASYMDDRIAAHRHEVEMLARNVPAEALEDRRRMHAYLDSQVRVWGHDYFNLLAIDLTGEVTASLRSPRGRVVNVSDTAYFRHVLLRGEGVVSEPLRSRVSGENVVVVAAPIRDRAGKMVKMLAASISLENSGFLSQLPALKPGKTGYLFMLTPQGIVIDHPDRKRVLQNVHATPGKNHGTERALSGYEGWLEVTSKDGRDSIYAYKRLQSTGWILAARYPTDEAFGPLEKIRQNAFFVSLSLAVTCGLMAWLLVYRLLAPLEGLRDQVRAIRGGRAEIGVLRSPRQDEIGQLGQAFYDLMAEREVAEGHLADSERRMRLITDNLPVLIAYLDRDRRFRFGNATFEKWFNVSPERLVGMSLQELMGEQAADQLSGHLEQAFAGRIVTCEVHLEILGTPRYLQGTYVPDLGPDGEVAGVYALKHDMTHVKEVEEQLLLLARVDTLTGIANRRSFNETLAQALERSRRHDKPLALAYLDIDHFKRINDGQGHGVGDEVLKEFARRLRDGVRATDTPARLSGDEFVVILEDIGSRQEAETIAGKIVTSMRTPFETSKGPVQASTSVGVALSQPGQSQEQLLAAADSALYTAKRRGRDGYAVYEG